MNKADWIFMPHAGHFIAGSKCQFRLNTYVNGYIVSTVGEYVVDSVVRQIMCESRGIPFVQGDRGEHEFGYEDIGLDRKYETMVFKAQKAEDKCCPYKIIVQDEMDFAAYNERDEAYVGHMGMCEKWSTK